MTTPTAQASEAEHWSYNGYRATLKRNGRVFAILTPDGRNAMSISDAKLICDKLNQTAAKDAEIESLRATCAELVTDGNAVTLAENLAKKSQEFAALRTRLERAEELAKATQLIFDSFTSAHLDLVADNECGTKTHAALAAYREGKS